MTHPLVTQLRFARRELLRGLEGLSAEEAQHRFFVITSYSIHYTKLYENDLLKQHQENTKKESNPKNIDERIYPEKVMILNFNYTFPFKEYGGNCDVVNVHGQLNSRNYPMVFGYGDERDEKYLELEKSGIDEFLVNIKSFAYFQNKNYDELLGFIEQNDFEVWIAGHSCGLSDKTLLAQIFEHQFCKSVRVFYHEHEGADNYNEIVYNIARVMRNKIKMRGIVTPNVITSYSIHYTKLYENSSFARRQHIEAKARKQREENS